MPRKPELGAVKRLHVRWQVGEACMWCGATSWPETKAYDLVECGQHPPGARVLFVDGWSLAIWNDVDRPPMPLPAGWNAPAFDAIQWRLRDEVNGAVTTQRASPVVAIMLLTRALLDRELPAADVKAIFEEAVLPVVRAGGAS